MISTHFQPWARTLAASLFQLFTGEPVEQGRVGDPAGAVGIEQVAQHGTASGFIGLDGDETRQLAVGIDMRLGERIADAVGIAPSTIRAGLSRFFPAACDRR